MCFQFFALYHCPTLVHDFYISATFVRVKVGLQTAQFSHPLTAQSLLGALNFKVINLTFENFIENVVDVLVVAVWACLLLLEPVLETGLTKVLRTADHAVRVTKNFFADIAVETFRDWLGKCEIISTILRYICCNHLEFVRLKRVVGHDTG